jgi:hypothetical protein
MNIHSPNLKEHSNQDQLVKQLLLHLPEYSNLERLDLSANNMPLLPDNLWLHTHNHFDCPVKTLRDNHTV